MLFSDFLMKNFIASFLLLGFVTDSQLPANELSREAKGPEIVSNVKEGLLKTEKLKQSLDEVGVDKKIIAQVSKTIQFLNNKYIVDSGIADGLRVFYNLNFPVPDMSIPDFEPQLKAVNDYVNQVISFDVSYAKFGGYKNLGFYIDKEEVRFTYDDLNDELLSIGIGNKSYAKDQLKEGIALLSKKVKQFIIFPVYDSREKKWVEAPKEMGLIYDENGGLKLSKPINLQDQSSPWVKLWNIKVQTLSTLPFGRASDSAFTYDEIKKLPINLYQR